MQNKKTIIITKVLTKFTLKNKKTNTKYKYGINIV